MTIEEALVEYESRLVIATILSERKEGGKEGLTAEDISNKRKALISAIDEEQCGWAEWVEELSGGS